MTYIYGGLLLVLILLKLTGQTAITSWTWRWVLSPLWLPAVVYLLLFAVGFIVGWLFPAQKNPQQ